MTKCRQGSAGQCGLTNEFSTFKASGTANACCNEVRITPIIRAVVMTSAGCSGGADHPVMARAAATGCVTRGLEALAAADCANIDQAVAVVLADHLSTSARA